MIISAQSIMKIPVNAPIVAARLWWYLTAGKKKKYPADLRRRTSSFVWQVQIETPTSCFLMEKKTLPWIRRPLWTHLVPGCLQQYLRTCFVSCLIWRLKIRTADWKAAANLPSRCLLLLDLPLLFHLNRIQSRNRMSTKNNRIIPGIPRIFNRNCNLFFQIVGANAQHEIRI